MAELKNFVLSSHRVVTVQNIMLRQKAQMLENKMNPLNTEIDVEAHCWF